MEGLLNNLLPSDPGSASRRFFVSAALWERHSFPTSVHGLEPWRDHIVRDQSILLRAFHHAPLWERTQACDATLPTLMLQEPLVQLRIVVGLRPGIVGRIRVDREPYVPANGLQRIHHPLGSC